MEADLSLTQMALDTSGNAGDEHLAVRFVRQERLNESKSRTEGRPFFEECDYIEIRQPGNKDSVIKRPVRESDKNRFPRHWQAYQNRMSDDEILQGTPLTEWPAMTRSQVEELRFLNIRTVEQLAEVSDSNTQGFMGLSLLKKKAAAYLDAAKETALAEAYASVKEENASLKADMAKLAQKVELLTELTQKPRTTRKKAAAEEKAETE